MTKGVFTYLAVGAVAGVALAGLSEGALRAAGTSANEELTLFAHVYLLPEKGVYILENLNLEELARARCYRFAFVGIPLKLTGATGSPLRPLALA